MNLNVNQWIQKLSRKKWVTHPLFWFFSYYILLKIFTKSGELHKIDYIYTLLFHVTILPGVYFNLLFLIPKFLSRDRYLVYAFLAVVTVLFSALLNQLFFGNWVDYLMPGYYFIADIDFWELPKYYGGYLVITSLVKLSKEWFRLSESEKKLALLKEQKVNVELKALRSQINPHFLFNNLNNVYGLSLKKDDRTAEVILKLSDSLRYILYDSNVAFIKLDKEIDFLRNYLELQELRSDREAKVSFITEGDFKQVEIAPLLFIPLVENSFKYGLKGDVKNAFIDIKLIVQQGVLHFNIKNNLGEVDDMAESRGGIGLENLKKRLSLIYPERHELKIFQDTELFIVQLNLQLT